MSKAPYFYPDLDVFTPQIAINPYLISRVLQRLLSTNFASVLIVFIEE